MDTPKAKAKKLVYLHVEFTPGEEEYEFPYAKKAALITVNECLQVAHSDSRANSHLDKEYWLKVKQEIEKL